MKKIILLAGFLLLCAVIALAYTFSPQPLAVEAEATPVVVTKPSSANVSLAVLHTGVMLSDELFAFRGGRAGVEYQSAISAVLVQHPAGDLLIDSGFGQNAQQHLLTTPWLMQKLAKLELAASARQQLQAQQYDLAQLKGIYLTHAHWDHVSGAEDFANVPLRLPQAEQQFIDSGNAHTALARSLAEKLTLQPYAFESGAYELWQTSHDVYADGSVVIVPLRGHTPGSVGVFVNLASGKRYLFVGDTVWAKEGVQLPAERPWLARRMVDNNAAENRDAIVKLHQLSQRYPELLIVPAHDFRLQQQMAQYPDVER